MTISTQSNADSIREHAVEEYVVPACDRRGSQSVGVEQSRAFGLLGSRIQQISKAKPSAFGL
jgi:hypothetical protein